MEDKELLEKIKDPHWRLRNLYYIKDRNKKDVIFTPNEAQEKFLDRFWYRNIIPKARQRGFSTLIQILMLDTCLFNKEIDAATIAQNKDAAKSIRDGKILYAYERLPLLIQEMVPLVKQNERELVWGNKSRMTISTSARGGTIHFLHISEYGVICRNRPLTAVEVQEGSLPAVTPTGICVIESTVESPMGIFSDMVREAEALEERGVKLSPIDYRLHFASWWDADEYEIDPEEIEISPEDHAYFDRLEAEIGRSISLRKRAWYVNTRSASFAGNQEKMWRQYPSTLKEAFTVATDGLWLAEQLSRARRESRITTLPLVPGVPVNTFWDIGTDDATTVWLHQQIGTKDHFVGYIEGSGEPPSYYVRRLQEQREQRGFVWGRHYLPHDGAHRRIGAQMLKTYQDFLLDLGLTDVEIVPRCEDVNVAIDGMREDFTSYFFDAEQCKTGVDHLAAFMKIFNNSMQVWTGGIAKNGHQHAADALRQVSQAKQAGLLSGTRGQVRPRRRNSSGLVV